MKENKQRMMFQDIVNHRLSNLQGNPWLAQRIIAESKGEQPIMKKRISVALVLAIAFILVAATALAVGLIFSSRYDASKLANEAMLNKYGITDKMMTVFYREVAQGADESVTVTYTPIEDVFHSGNNQLGVYSVTVKDGKAEAVWSHDGEDTSGALDAKAWGAEQIGMMVTDYQTVMQYLHNSTGTRSSSDSPDDPVATPPVSMEEYERLQAEIREKVESAAKITLMQAKENAVMALVSEYGLTNQQVTLLAVFEGEETYQFEDGRPTVSLFFHLSQGDVWTEKDGIYVVDINMETGEIEDIIYDSGLAANG